MDLKATILIVDDTPANLVALEAILTELDATIVKANSGNQALSLTLKQDFAMVLLDVQMPGMTGYEVASILGQNADTKGIPIIFLTAAYKDEQHMLKGYSSGAVDYIEKPIKDEILIPKVRFFLQLYEHQHQLKALLKKEEESNEKLKKEMELRSKVEHQLLLAKQQADQAVAAKSQFMATMSHEIRTPMNGVLGMAELLGDSELTEVQRQQVKIIISSGNTLLTVINDILDFSKLEAGRVELESIPFNLEYAIHEVLQIFLVRVYEIDMELILDYAPDVPHDFIGDPGRLRQILNNLVGNAIKFTERGYIRITVKATMLNDKTAEVMISVEDTGLGVKADKVSQLFDSFTQADSSTTREYGGTGLGLSICKQLIEIMQGEIWAESEFGKGSCFNVKLPLVLADVPAAFVNQNLKGVKILLVDDNDINRELFMYFLQHFNTNAISTDRADNVIDILKESVKLNEPYDAVLLDCNMPGTTGLDVGKKIRSTQVIRDIKLIALTSSAVRGDVKLFLEAGFNASLAKPVRGDILHDTIVDIMSDGREDKDLIAQHSIAESKQPSVHQFKGNILLVDDTTINQLIAVAMLEKMGLNVDLADNGKQAVELCKTNKYDLVFMDCRMPIMDGYQATYRICNDKTIRPIPIIALTANAVQEERDKCIEAGMKEVITKPFKSTDLVKVLNHYLVRDADLCELSVSVNAVKNLESSIDVEIFDRLKQVVGKVLPELLVTFRQVTEDTLTKLENWQGENENDPDEFVRLPHSLKSSSANVGAMKLSSLAETFEELAQDNKKTEALQGLKSIWEEYKHVDEEFKNMGYPHKR